MGFGRVSFAISMMEFNNLFTVLLQNSHKNSVFPLYLFAFEV